MQVRTSFGGVVYHVLNRAAARRRIFEADGDYRAFEKLVEEARVRVDMRILDYCVMPNHWHFVLWPRQDGDLARFIGWLAMTHAKRWHGAHHSTGTGALYQSRYRFFAVQSDEHLWVLRRYVMRNPVRAGLVGSASEWEFSSAACRMRRTRWIDLDPGPLPLPSDWLARVDEPQSEAERTSLRESLRRGAPLGDAEWTESACIRHFGVPCLRARGRPPKKNLVGLFRSDAEKTS